MCLWRCHMLAKPDIAPKSRPQTRPGAATVQCRECRCTGRPLTEYLLESTQLLAPTCRGTRANPLPGTVDVEIASWPTRKLKPATPRKQLPAIKASGPGVDKEQRDSS